VRRSRLCAALVFAASIHALAQNPVEGWFPLHPGDRWTYEHETRDENGEGPAHLEIHRWTTEETIIGSWTVSQGTLIGKKVRVNEGALPPSYIAYPDEVAYLVRGNCVYTREVDWNPQRHQLTADFVKLLDRGAYSADFCFPLVTGETWGAPHWAEWRSPAEAKDWQVVNTESHDPAAPDKRQMFHITSISSYLGSGMSDDVWFEKGVGIVREDEIHHGTIGEFHTRLLRFQPASNR